MLPWYAIRYGSTRQTNVSSRKAHSWVRYASERFYKLCYSAALRLIYFKCPRWHGQLHNTYVLRALLLCITLHLSIKLAIRHSWLTPVCYCYSYNLYTHTSRLTDWRVYYLFMRTGRSLDDLDLGVLAGITVSHEWHLAGGLLWTLFRGSWVSITRPIRIGWCHPPLPLCIDSAAATSIRQCSRYNQKHQKSYYYAAEANPQTVGGIKLSMPTVAVRT